MPIRYNPRTLLLTLDLAGTAVFAIEGATSAIQGNLDLLGLMVLAFATALGGGIIRDILIGAVPPSSIQDWRYPATALATALGVFLFHNLIARVPEPLIVTADAVGLGLFAVSGAAKALDFGLHPLIAVMMGGITGVGGGTIRDLLLARVPLVLRSDIYAAAAMAGAIVMILCLKVRVRPAFAAACGAVFCFLLRMVAVWRHWNLPHVLSR